MLLLLFFFVVVQSEDKTVLFAVGSTLVNCTNSYEVEKPDPQMVELAKYAKQHVPEEHPKVGFFIFVLPYFVDLPEKSILNNQIEYESDFAGVLIDCPYPLCVRMHLLMWRKGWLSSLKLELYLHWPAWLNKRVLPSLRLVKSVFPGKEGKCVFDPPLCCLTSRVLGRVFLALVERQEDRGTVVAQGGGKALIPLATENTDAGKVKAAQALAKIAITSNPEIAFPGERVRMGDSNANNFL